MAGYPLLKLSSALKRKVMPLIKKDYVRKKLEKRKGECRRCGQCCRGCPNLGKDNLCRVYENRPSWLCFRDFPLDELDQRAWNVKDCGYSFD